MSKHYLFQDMDILLNELKQARENHKELVSRMNKTQTRLFTLEEAIKQKLSMIKLTFDKGEAKVTE